MVLTGRVNKSLVTLIQQAGGRAVGLCGKDSEILQARQMVEKDIGYVGEVTKVRCVNSCCRLARCAYTQAAHAAGCNVARVLRHCTLDMDFNLVVCGC